MTTEEFPRWRKGKEARGAHDCGVRHEQLWIGARARLPCDCGSVVCRSSSRSHGVIHRVSAVPELMVAGNPFGGLRRSLF